MGYLMGLCWLVDTGGGVSGEPPAPLTPGQKAPFFQARNQEGKEVRLDDFKGRWLILSFFVKAHTSG